MSSLLISLGGGSLLLIVACMGLGRRFGRRRGALMSAILVTAAYLLLAAARWPGVDVAAIHVALFATIALTFSLLPARGSRGARSRPAWGPVFIVVFFLVVVVVNVVFLLLAQHGLPSGIAALVLPRPAAEASFTSKFPGTVTPGTHKRELLYDRHLQRLDEQTARGWQIAKGWVAKPVAGQAAVFQVRIQDRSGQPVQGATVRGSFLRPSDRAADRSFVMSEARGGNYQTEISLPLAGSWHLLLWVEWGDDRHELRGTTAVLPAITGS